jgi:hypothetical protein
MTRIAYASTIILAILCMSSVSFAQVVFEDDFDAENGSTGQLNYTGFANWTVSDGFVDLMGNGFHDFYPGSGLFVELDGSGSDAAVFTSSAIAVSPGTYLLQFDLGINNAGSLIESMNVTLGGDYAETFDETDAGLPANFNLISRQIQVTSAGNVAIVFDHAGGDNFGLIIDNVSLARIVPEPTSVVLLGLCSLGILVRRR